MRVWITKYALSVGIQEKEVEDCGGRMVKGPGTFEYFHGEGREWHRHREPAVERAEIMRENKINSLRKNITKLEKMKF